MPFFPHSFYWLIPLVVVDAILKGFALWRASQYRQAYWFIALFVVNSAGILPLIYLAFFQPTQQVQPAKRK